ncbi:NACHT domain-containing protein [Floridanema evergladense]|uniref:NACHT domain-containing protein n=1 Tax=Floridaenema evergladense BLCC-F167 TaxID=3153639 RepID=A0ABV4WPG1_9CYAN
MKKIMVLSANPKEDLKLGQEIRDLQYVIKRNGTQAKFDIEIALAVRRDELQQLFLEHQPRIVHFCGHGTGEQGLVFQDDAGKKQLLTTDALYALLKLFDNRIECVLLNACYSQEQAKGIVNIINYAIGMNQEIRDDAAIAFATGFYRGLAFGNSIEQSYELGCNAIQIHLAIVNRSCSETSKENRKLGAVSIPQAQQISIAEHLKPILNKKESLTSITKESSTISDELITAVLKEMNRTRPRYLEQAKIAWDNFGQAHTSPDKTDTQTEYRNRKILIEKIKNFWIEGVLNNSLHNAFINLSMVERADSVQPRFSGVEEFPVELNQSFEELQETDLFDEMGTGRTLLILGEPGAGKTITLLKLAERLIKRTEQNLSHPIPVVFNLSSWTNKLTIAEWLVEELKDKYQVSKALGKAWVEQEQLILLLDGLDEVALNKARHEEQVSSRNACVRALNEFIEEHGNTEIAICSRIQEYEALSERLKLRSAICIQPLTSEQVFQYLDEAGDKLAGLRTLLQNNLELKEFAQTPLILDVMSLAYEDCSPEELLNQIGSPEQRNQHLFDQYIERMLQRRKKIQPYSPEQTKRWLILLAKRMNETSQTIFLIEEMQPNWLPNSTLKLFYNLGTVLIAGLILALLVGLVSLGKVPSNLPVWMLILAGAILFYPSKIERFETLAFPWQKSKKSLQAELINGVKTGIIGVFVLSIVALILGNFPDLNIVNKCNGLCWVWNTFKWGLGLGLTLGLIDGTRGGEIKEKSRPNQGIWTSARNSIFLLLSSWIIIVIVFMILPQSEPKLEPREIIGAGLRWTVILVVVFGPGKTCIRHFTLRFILWIKNYIPWNYAHFLEYAKERIFLQKVGGGYKFIHRMLLEHFARMNLN